MAGKEKTFVLTSTLILIALGVLIILNSSGVYVFDKSWPIVMIVISVGILVERIEDIGGWLIGVVGIIFIVMRNFYPKIESWVQYVLPVVLIILGIYMLFERFKKVEK
ncbi:MAG: hypothetical protein J7J07_01660 [Syntrophobacterales bacterium]|nr:hypothetical protein [Syntrophobacterales bacterium]